MANHAKDIFTPKPIPRTINSRIGLGTVIHRALHPFASVVGLGGCAGCRRRARKLDKLMPNVNPFAK